MSLESEYIEIESFGGTDVMQWREAEVRLPGDDEILIKHDAIGVNYIDVYHRSGTYGKPLSLPSGLGLEGAGVVEVVGDGVSDFTVGERVAYVGGPPGAYSTRRCLPAARAVAVPEGIRSEIAAAIIFKGLTAEYLLRRCYTVQPGDVVLLHAASGGVGSLASQWLKLIGAITIGTVSSEQKATCAKSMGCDHVIVYTRENFVESVRELTDGRGVDVVYDSVGKDTLEGSMDVTRPRGTVVSFGEASGPVQPIEPSALAARGSLFFTRPSVAHYTAAREELTAAAGLLFDLVEQGQLNLGEASTYPLRDVARAHEDLEQRRTRGSIVLLPDA